MCFAAVVIGLFGEMACAQLGEHIVEQVIESLAVEMALDDSSE